MVKALAILALSATLAHAQYLLTTDKPTAQEFVTLLDKLCGYPNPATLTYTAVSIDETKDGFMVLVPTGVYSPKVKAYIDANNVLPTVKPAPITSTNDLAKALTDAAKLPPLTEKDKLTSANYVLIATALKETLEKADTNRVVTPK